MTRDTTLRAAAQAALAALAGYRCGLGERQPCDAEVGLSAALAQPEPASEPVAWIYEWNSVGGVHRALTPGPYNGMRPDRTIPVYATPPQRKPLSEEEIGKIREACSVGITTYALQFAQAIESAHGIE